MTAELHILDTGQTPGPGSGNMAVDEMDEVMAAPTKAFLAGVETAGVGAQPLAPKVLGDGTKEFDLTTRVVDWEVEPGKVVKAWAYNGTVPGPTLKVDIGDRVKVVLHNELPSRLHPLPRPDDPNSMDGVPDITQPPVKPGRSFTYEFVAKGPAVGMYHSHHNAVKQVPNGLAGMFLVGQQPLPAGARASQEIPMMLNDSGAIGLSLNGKSFPATAPVVVGLGEYVLVHATEPGAWAWHCHILTHAETEKGMFGMVTAMIVR